MMFKKLFEYIKKRREMIHFQEGCFNPWTGTWWVRFPLCKYDWEWKELDNTEKYYYFIYLKDSEDENDWVTFFPEELVRSVTSKWRCFEIKTRISNEGNHINMDVVKSLLKNNGQEYKG